MIDWIAVSYLIPLLLALFVGAYSMYDAGSCPDKKRPYRIFTATLCWYFVVLYILALTGNDTYLLKSGLLTRMGVIMALSSIGAEIYFSRKGYTNHHSNGSSNAAGLI